MIFISRISSNASLLRLAINFYNNHNDWVSRTARSLTCAVCAAAVSCCDRKTAQKFNKDFFLLIAKRGEGGYVGGSRENRRPANVARNCWSRLIHQFENIPFSLSSRALNFIYIVHVNTVTKCMFNSLKSSKQHHSLFLRVTYLRIT